MKTKLEWLLRGISEKKASLIPPRRGTTSSARYSAPLWGGVGGGCTDNAIWKFIMAISPIHLILLGAFAGSPVLAQTTSPAGDTQGSGDEMGELATKLNNPTASLISVPLQSNFDFGGGLNDNGFQYKLNIQPVIPFKLNEDWKILSRTILPYIHQEDRIGTSSQSGLGDASLTLWLSPEKAAPGKPIWAFGPVFLLPTATDDLLGTEKWGAGPSLILLRQTRGWTYGALMSHTWSFAGESGRQDVSSTFLQPFVAYQTRTHTTFTINSETTYDWENKEWTIPLNALITQLVRIGKMPVSFQFGGRYYAEKPSGGPDWGLRFTVTLVFPE